MKLQSMIPIFSLIALCLLGCDAKGESQTREPSNPQTPVIKIAAPTKDLWRAPLAKAMGIKGEIEVRESVTSAFGYICGMARSAQGRGTFKRFIVYSADNVLLETKMPWPQFRAALIADCAMEE